MYIISIDFYVHRLLYYLYYMVVVRPLHLLHMLLSAIIFVCKSYMRQLFFRLIHLLHYVLVFLMIDRYVYVHCVFC
jgi:hypothetical protein